MNLRIYAIRDYAIEAFLPIFTARTDNEAKRMFTDSVVKGHGNIKGNETQFALFRLGEFNDANGVLTGETATLILAAKDITLQKGD